MIFRYEYLHPIFIAIIGNISQIMSMTKFGVKARMKGSKQAAKNKKKLEAQKSAGKISNGKMTLKRNNSEKRRRNSYSKKEFLVRSMSSVFKLQEDEESDDMGDSNTATDEVESLGSSFGFSSEKKIAKLKRRRTYGERADFSQEAIFGS